MLNFYPKMYYSGGGGGGGADAGGGGGAGSAAGGAGGGADGGSAVGTGVGGLKVNNLCGEGGRNAINGSVFFDGSYYGNYTYLDVDPPEPFGTRDFTIEFFINQDGRNTSNYTIIFTIHTTDAKGFEVAFHNGTIQVYTDTGSWRDTGYTPTVNEYEHIAFQRDYSAQTLKMYVNGEEKWSVSNSTDYDSAISYMYIGSYGVSGYGHFTGFISNFRICTGHLIYFSNYFTPPTSPLTAHYTSFENKTTLLCCQNSDNPLEENSITIRGENIPKTITGYGRHADTSVELVPNGGPTTNVTGWTANRGTVEYAGGQIKVTRSGGTGFASYATITNAVVGQRYRVSAQIRSVSSRCDLYVTTAIESGSLLLLSGTAGETVDVTGVFRATATTLYIFTAVDTNGDVGYYNRVSMKAADHGVTPKIAPPFGTDNGVTFGGAIAMNSSAYMCIPVGRTEERGRGRGIWGGGWNSPSTSSTNNIDYIQIQSGGQAKDFGDLTEGGNQMRANSSSTRGVFIGGRRPHPGVVNIMDYVEIATTGNALDFGDLLTGRGAVGEISSQTRGISAAGYNPGNTNVIEYITIATLGNSQDFGDTEASGAGSTMAGTQSSTRGILAGNYTPSSPNTSDIIQYLTIATLGNTQDFGDLTESGRHSASGTSNGVRAVFAAGTHLSPGSNNTMDYVTIASTGDAIDFGDLGSISTGQVGATSDNIRGVFGGGSNTPLYYNVIQQVTIATTGNSVNIGDLTLQRLQPGCCSDSHGGLS